MSGKLLSHQLLKLGFRSAVRVNGFAHVYVNLSLATLHGKVRKSGHDSVRIGNRKGDYWYVGFGGERKDPLFKVHESSISRAHAFRKGHDGNALIQPRQALFERSQLGTTVLAINQNVVALRMEWKM